MSCFGDVTDSFKFFLNIHWQKYSPFLVEKQLFFARNLGFKKFDILNIFTKNLAVDSFYSTYKSIYEEIFGPEDGNNEEFVKINNEVLWIDLKEVYQ